MRDRVSAEAQEWWEQQRRPERDPAAPLEFLPVNFSLSSDEKLRGAMGVPAHVLRRKALEDRMERLWKEFEERYQALEATVGRRRFGDAWVAAVRSWPLEGVQRMVDDFNRYYPIEANLRMDPEFQDFVVGDSRFERARVPTEEEILARFPARGGSR